MQLKSTCRRLAALLLTVVLAAPLFAHADDEALAQARSLAFSGQQHRGEALSLLQQHLAQEPDDNEARVFYGIVLSWEGRYDEARVQLERVLARHPDHADALPALINVELWSDHPKRAETLARAALERHPNRVPLLLAEARAFRNENRRQDELRVLDQVLRLEPNNPDAKKMRRTLVEASANWETSVTHAYSWYSDGRDPLEETQVSLRAPSPVGSLTASFNRANQYGESSYQSDFNLYPHFRPGTYANLEVGYSADANLYPRYRLGADLFQSLGHGWEGSGGYRRLSFGDGIDIYTFALAKYYGNWLFTGRGFVTPGAPGTSGTGVLSARRFFGSEGLHDYVEFRYSHGASPALADTLRDIEVLTSSRFSVNLDKVLRPHWVAEFGGSISTEQRMGLRNLQSYSVQGSIYYRF